ncbi:MAG: hypothetical protein AMXMBFR23_10040 [Chloroflexota bacterium]
MGVGAMKRIVVCIDGTTNATEVVTGKPATNVVLFTRAVAPKDADGHLQIIEYVPGVATDDSARGVGRFAASMNARGFSQIVQEAYEFLSNNYAFGDRVYLLGFSRGAAAARSVSGMTELFGVIPKRLMAQFPEAWKFYNTEPSKRDLAQLARKAPELAQIAEVGVGLRRAHRAEAAGGPAVGAPDLFSQYGHAPTFEIRPPHEPGQSPHDLDRGDTRAIGPVPGYIPLPLHFIGVWDTVFALGGQEKFHERGLAWNVGRAFHALAVHEFRNDFAPTLWRLHCPHQLVVQTWFPGNHSDVGGGNGREDLSSIPLEWMIHNAEGDGLRFDWAYLESVLVRPPKAKVSAEDLKAKNVKAKVENLVWSALGFDVRFMARGPFKHAAVEARASRVSESDYSEQHRKRSIEADTRSRNLPPEPVAEMAERALSRVEGMYQRLEDAERLCGQVSSLSEALLASADPSQHETWSRFMANVGDLQAVLRSIESDAEAIETIRKEACSLPTWAFERLSREVLLAVAQDLGKCREQAGRLDAIATQTVEKVGDAARRATIEAHQRLLREKPTLKINWAKRKRRE